VSDSNQCQGEDRLQRLALGIVGTADRTEDIPSDEKSPWGIPLRGFCVCTDQERRKQDDNALQFAGRKQSRAFAVIVDK